MRRILILTIASILTLIGLGVLFFSKIKRDQIDYQKEILHTQSQKCGSMVEATMTGYESDLNRIIFKHINEIHMVFDDPQAMYYISRDLEGFYSKYRDLVTSIFVYDNEDSFLGLYINERDDFVVDTFSRQDKNQLEPKDIIMIEGSNYVSYFPFFKEGELNGNIVIEIDIEKYIGGIFEQYFIPDVLYQWVISQDTEIVISNFEEGSEIRGIEIVADSIRNEKEGDLEHSFSFEGKSFKVLSSYYPLSVLHNDLGIVFTINTGHLVDAFIKDYIILSAIILLIISALIAYLIFLIFNQKKGQKGMVAKLMDLKMILEHFPVGIMVLDDEGRIKMINESGQSLIFKDKNKNMVGKSFEKQFLESNNYLLQEGMVKNYDDTQFFHYFQDGNEFVIYKKEVTRRIQGEELTLSAYVDVSPIEKSRKQEAAANRAKSDFLAKMSHEIRNPMNGIIGMTENLLLEKLDKNIRSQVEVIQKSAELLLTIINDILDFSKIEAGKMMLEEIPFSLSEEMDITSKLYSPLIEEKGLRFKLSIDKSIPDRLIGDPFRLRQVISNLISNSIKFTREGMVSISVSMAEKSSNLGLSLLFKVEDSGIGIPKDKIESIFGSYQQAGGSTSRKFGGTGLGMAISKQLVELMNGEIWIESPSTVSKKKMYPGTAVSFTVDVFSDEQISKSFDYSGITRFNQITALILSRKKDESDKVHRVLDSFGINYNYRLYDDNSLDSTIYHIEQKSSLYQLIIIKDKPDGEGFGLAMQLKENGISEKYPVMMISTNDKPGNYLKCKSMLVDYYLIQPYDNHEVFNVLIQTFTELEDASGVLDTINRIKTNLKILIADDNIINQRVVQSLFKHLGHEVDIAGNGEEAVEKASRSTYDLVLMDILMPIKDGLTATHEIRESGNNVTIVAMTGSDESEKKEIAFKAGMNDYLTKPVKVEAIKHLLIKWFSEALEV